MPEIAWQAVCRATISRAMATHVDMRDSVDRTRPHAREAAHARPGDRGAKMLAAGGHTKWSEIVHKEDRLKLERWRNHVATITVPEAVVDRFTDELLDRLEGGVATIEQDGTTRRVELTIEANWIGSLPLMLLVGEVLEVVGADHADARFTEEYAWARPDPA
jgi:hypothetical protein